MLDHAERLLALPKVGLCDQPNYLAQLLLVPRTVGVQLTIVAITNSHLLEYSRTSTAPGANVTARNYNSHRTFLRSRDAPSGRNHSFYPAPYLHSLPGLQKP